MAVFDRLSIRVAAVGAGLCSIALALSPGVAQAGGYECVDTSAGQAPAAAGAAGVGAGAAACAPISEMSGVPILPGPLAPPPVVPPVVPPLVPPPVVPPLVPPPVVPPLVPPPVVPPIVPPVAPPPVIPPVAPLIPAAGAVGGLPTSTMGGLAGKGDMTGPAPIGAPVAGQPISPGPTG